jgi:pimeloyl-ACP methyl ester carboxylesterase
MIVPPSFAHEAYDNLGSSIKKLVLFERSGHTPMLSEPDLFAEEVLLFMDENK